MRSWSRLVAVGVALTAATVVGARYLAPRAPSAAAAAGAPASAEPSRSSPATPARPHRVAVSAAFESEEEAPVYRELVAYLAEKTGSRYEVVSGLGYGPLVEMLKTGDVEFGFVCACPDIVAPGNPNPAIEILAGPIIKNPRYGGKPVFFSDLIVRKDSSFKSLQELAGRTYVYNGDLSLAGYTMPRSHLVDLGLTHGFFRSVLRSGSHRESIRMVADGLADASYVSSLVLDHDRDKGLRHAAAVRVVESLGPSPTPPVVASSKTPVEERERFQRHLVTMDQDPQGRKILDRALVERFVTVTYEDYEPVRAMQKRAKDADFMVIK
jgi:phosphonate transport system substrate-binding protein